MKKALALLLLPALTYAAAKDPVIGKYELKCQGIEDGGRVRYLATVDRMEKPGVYSGPDELGTGETLKFLKQGKFVCSLRNPMSLEPPNQGFDSSGTYSLCFQANLPYQKQVPATGMVFEHLYAYGYFGDVENTEEIRYHQLTYACSVTRRPL